MSEKKLSFVMMPLELKSGKAPRRIAATMATDKIKKNFLDLFMIKLKYVCYMNGGREKPIIKNGNKKKMIFYTKSRQFNMEIVSFSVTIFYTRFYLSGVHIWSLAHKFNSPIRQQKTSIFIQNKIYGINKTQE